MTGKHTPGPWVKSHYDDISDEILIETPEGEYVSSIDCDGCYDGRIGKVIEANAHLIAAAPDLLEALKLVARYLPDDIIRCNGDKCRNPWCASCFGEADAYAFMDKLEADRKFIRAAIAKARGQE